MRSIRDLLEHQESACHLCKRSLTHNLDVMDAIVARAFYTLVGTRSRPKPEDGITVLLCPDCGKKHTKKETP